MSDILHDFEEVINERKRWKATEKAVKEVPVGLQEKKRRQVTTCSAVESKNEKIMVLSGLLYMSNKVNATANR